MRRHLLLTQASGMLLASVTAALAYQGPAAACGGTFCDRGPRAMPVDQKGENILYVLSNHTVEAHIQIQYKGEAPQFAWVLPIPFLPEVEVGSQPLFDALLGATVPSYGYQSRFDTCGKSAGGADAATASFDAARGGAPVAGGGPEVVLKKIVGAFDVTVLKGGSAQEVADWLDANGYQQSPAATPLLDEYVQKHYLFVAVKLVGGAGVDQIHPLVVRYTGETPCVPLKLTKIAAVPDMGVRTFFLGTGRVVPTNYKHVVVNPVRIDWLALGSNYNTAVSYAVDAQPAAGHGFVTEYAGPSNVVSTAAVYNSGWDSRALQATTPDTLLGELSRQTLVQCPLSSSGPAGMPAYPCSFTHALLEPLLEEFLPPPMGMSGPTYYACPTCLQAGDRSKWDAQKFAAAFESRIAAPGKHATQLLAQYPYLTRMFTTISPEEMTDDPEFHARPDLPPVARSKPASLRQTCSGARAMILPDGREVGLMTGGTWPPFFDKMPNVEAVETIPVTGPVQKLTDNTALIDDELARWNMSVGWPPPDDNNDAQNPMKANGAAPGGGTSTDSPADGGVDVPPRRGLPQQADSSSGGGGGGCSVPGSGQQAGGSALWLFALGAITWMGKRRRSGAS